MPKISKPQPRVIKPKAKPTLKKSNKRDFASMITPLEDLDEEGIKLMIYGNSGSGKTRLAGTFASEDTPMLHLVCSSNGTNETRSIRGAKGIDVLQIERPDDLPEIVDYVRSSDKYTTVTLDHVTEFGNCVLSAILGLERLPEQNSWGMAKQEDYQQMGIQVKEYLRELLSLKQNVIIIAQERVYNQRDETATDSIDPYVSAASSPAITSWLAPACDYIIRMYKKRRVEIVKRKIGGKVKLTERRTDQVDYCAMVGPHPTFMTKFRVPIGIDLPDIIVNPSYDKIKELLG